MNNIMRTLILTLAIVAIGLAQQQPPMAWYDYPPVTFGPRIDVWEVALFSSKQGYSRVEPISVKIVARNNGAAAIRVSRPSSYWMTAEFKVARIPGDEVLKMRPYKNAIDRMEKNGGSIALFNVRPGGVFYPPVVDLQKIFDVTPGNYTVVATVRLPPADTSKGTNYILVDSNPIPISVLPQ